MTALIIGLVLIVGGVLFAAAPLLRRRSGGKATRPDARGEREIATSGRVDESAATRDSARPLDLASSLQAELDELELDRAMGKLDEGDYLRLVAAARRRVTRQGGRLQGEGTRDELAPHDAAVAGAVPEEAAAPKDAAAPEQGDRNALPRDGTARHVARATAERALLEVEADRLIAALAAERVTCSSCGVRPEPGARFCSRCGRSLGDCPACGNEVRQRGARFCDRCGASLQL